MKSNDYGHKESGYIEKHQRGYWRDRMVEQNRFDVQAWRAVGVVGAVAQLLYLLQGESLSWFLCSLIAIGAVYWLGWGTLEENKCN